MKFSPPLDIVGKALGMTVLAVALAACGGGDSGTPVASGGTSGGSGGGSGGGVTAVSFSGTAATGLPLVGTVTVKDFLGATKTVTLGINGSYTVDVTGMTGPFVFRATGTAGGRTTTIYSAATSADANGTINITPLTDVVVANIAGDLAANYFNSGTFSGLSATALAAESAALKAKLLPVLQAMGVDASIDLLRSSFTPLSSALDKALDILRVSYDAGGTTATITNLVNQQVLTDSLAIKAAADANATPMPATNIDASAADDIAAIRKVLTDIPALFASAAPTPDQILPFLTNGSDRDYTYGFRFQDETPQAFATELASDPNMMGGTWTDIVFRRVNYTTNADNLGPRAFVEFSHKDKNGVIFSRQENMQLVKGTDGKWRLRGDGRALALDANVMMVKDSTAGCVTTGIEFNIEDINTANSTSTAYVMVTGPGLPEGGLKYARPNAGGYWTLANVGTQNGERYYRMATTCSLLANAGLSDSQISALSNEATYTFTGYTSADVVSKIGTSTSDLVFSDRTHGRPLTLAEAATAAFPVVTASPTLTGYSGGSAVTVSATGLNPAIATEIFLAITTTSGFVQEEADISTSTSGTASASLTLSAQTNITRREARVGKADSLYRELMTIISAPGSAILNTQ